MSETGYQREVQWLSAAGHPVRIAVGQVWQRIEGNITTEVDIIRVGVTFVIAQGLRRSRISLDGLLKRYTLLKDVGE